MSVSVDIESAAAALGVLAGEVNEEAWTYLRIVRANLQSLAEQTRQMENNFILPRKVIPFPKHLTTNNPGDPHEAN
jgi:hypothetical protein